MKIYRYIADADNYNCLYTESINSERKNGIGRGQSLQDGWSPLSVEDDLEGDAGNFPALTDPIPVLTENTWKILEPYLKNSVEALELVSKNAKYYALNVLDIVDALDLNKSEISYRSSGRVSSIQKFVFFPEKIASKLMFKVPQTKGLDVYVSDEFKKIVEQEGLKGLDFSKILFTTE